MQTHRHLIPFISLTLSCFCCSDHTISQEMLGKGESWQTKSLVSSRDVCNPPKDHTFWLRFSWTSSQNISPYLGFVFMLRPTEDLPREAKPSTDVNHNSSTTVIAPSSHGPGKTAPQVATSSSPASSSNSVLSNFLYGMPMSSKPHPDGKLDFKPMSLLNLGKDRLANWTAGTDKSMSVKDCASNGKWALVVWKRACKSSCLFITQ